MQDKYWITVIEEVEGEDCILARNKAETLEDAKQEMITLATHTKTTGYPAVIQIVTKPGLKPFFCAEATLENGDLGELKVLTK